MLKKTLNTDPTFGNRLLIVLWFLFVPLAVARSATVLDNTFDPATTSGLRVLQRDLSPSSWYATPITTDGFEYKLNSIKADIKDFGPPVGLFLEIWDVSTLTGGPSSSLGRLQLVDPGFPKEFEANILSGEISLSANTSYYVVTGVDNGGGSYREQINFADPPGPYFNVESGTWLLETVLPGLTNQMSFRSTTLDFSWQEDGLLAAPLRMTIDATSVCPEIVLSNTAGAVYNLNNTDATIKSLAGGGTSGGNVLLGSGTLSIGCQNGGAEFAGSISGTGRIIKIGSGTQTFTGANTYTGGTEIRLGVLAVSAIADSGASGLGNSGTLLLSGGTLSYTGTTNATTGRLVDVALSATNSTINISSASGHLTLTGNVWNSDVTHSNVVLNKTGVGTLEIAGAGRNVGLSLAAREGTTLLNGATNTIYEIRAIDPGATVQLRRPNQVFSGDAIPTTGNIRMTGGTLDLNGFDQTVNRLTGATFGTFGTGEITSAGPATFTFGSSLAGRPSDFAGTITGALNVVTKGANKVTLTGNNVYSGTTTISNANSLLQIGNGGTSGTLGGGAVLNNGTLAFDRSDDLTVANVISGPGRLVQQGAGTLTLAGNNTYSGTTTITNGALRIGQGGTSGALGLGTVTNNGILIFDRSDALTTANTINGSGSVVQQGAGTTTLTGPNTYTGTTAIDAGTLLLNGSHVGGAGYSVATGAAFGGTGQTDSSVTVDGTIRPGNGVTQGILQTGALTLNNTGLLNLLLGGPTSSLLSVTGNLSLLGGIDFTVAPALTADLYPLVSYTGSLSGTFSLTNNLPTGFNLVYGTNNTIFLERVPSIDGTAILASGDALITGGSLPFDVLVYNNSANSPVDFALGAATDTTGSFGPANIAPAGDTNAPGLAYNGTGIGTNTGTYVLSNLTAGTTSTNNVTVKVYDHAAGSLSTNMVVMPDVIVGYGAALSETLTVSNGAGFRVGLDSVSVNTNANFVVGDVANVAPGASGTMQVVLNPGQGAGLYSNVVQVSFADSSALRGATNNLSPTNFAVTGTVFDHALAVVSVNTITFAPVHAGYSNALSNSVVMSNAAGLRAPMLTANTITNTLFSLGTVNGLAPGASVDLVGELATGQPVGRFTNTVVIAYGDDSALEGALVKVGTTNVMVTGYIYSGQSTWTNNGSGNWTNFGNWDVPGGTPGLDGVLSVNDTATFGAAGSGDVVLDTNASVLAVVFSNSGASYNLNGGGTLTMAASGGTDPSISNQAGAHVIGASVELSGNVRVEAGSGSSLEMAGVVSGPGALTVDGPGLLALSGGNTYSGGTTLNAGDLVVKSPGALGGGAVTLNAGRLTLETRIDMASLFWNGAATIAMANPAGGQFVNIANGLTLVNGINNFDLTGVTLPRSRVKLMSAANMGSLSVDLFGVVGLDRYTLLIEGDSLFITAKPASYVPYAITPNQASVAGALNTFIGASGDRGTVVAALDSLTDAQYPAAFEQTLPNAYASLPNMAFNTANALNSGMFQRLWVIRINGKGFSSSGLSPVPLSGEVGGADDMDAFAISPSRESKWGTFVDGNGIFANGGDVNYLQNYRSQSGGVTSGASYKWNGSLSTGVYVGYQGLQAEYDNGRTVDNAVRFGVFGTYDLGSLYFNALVGGAYHGYTVNRTIDFGGLDRTATGRPGAGEFDLALGTGYDFKAGDFSWGPFTTLQYTYLGVQGFTETGAGALDLDVDPYNSSSMLYTLGGQAAYNWRFSKDVIVTPTVFAGWQHEFLQDAYQINSSFNTGGPAAPFSYTTGTPARDNFYGGAGVTVGLGDRWQATAIYSAFVANQDQSSQNLYLGLGYKF